MNAKQKSKINIEDIESENINVIYDDDTSITELKTNSDYISEIDELIEESMKIALSCNTMNKDLCSSLYIERIIPKLKKLTSGKSNELPDELLQLVKDLRDIILSK